MFCTNCGEKIKDGLKFCTSCGEELTVEEGKICTDNNTIKVDNYSIDDNTSKEEDDYEDYEEYEEEDYYYDTPSKPSHKRNPRGNNLIRVTKKQIIALSSVLIIVTLLIVGVVVFRSFNSPDKVIDSFKTAIAKEDYNALKEIVITSDERIEINEETLKPFLQSFSKKPSLISQITTDLNNDASKEEAIKTDLTKGNQNARLVKLFKKDRFLIGPKYYVMIQPVYANVNVKQSDVSIFLDDKKMTTTNKEDGKYEIGPFLPGEYTITAEGESYDDSAKDRKFLSYLNDIKTTVADVSLLSNFRNVNIKSNRPEGIIYLDGVNTGIKISEQEKLGLIKEGTQITGVINDSNGAFKSGSYSVNSGDVSLNFENQIKIAQAPEQYYSTSSLETKVFNTVKNYLNGFDDAVNYNDFSMIKNYMQYDSSIYNTQLKYISNTYKQGIKLELVDFNCSKYEFNSNNVEGNVIVTETFKVFIGGKEEVKTHTWRYGFAYNSINGSYQLTSIGES
ncbi:MAG: TcaA second domain-containing protein [Clostridium sp.]